MDREAGAAVRVWRPRAHELVTQIVAVLVIDDDVVVVRVDADFKLPRRHRSTEAHLDAAFANLSGADATGRSTFRYGRSDVGKIYLLEAVTRRRDQPIVPASVQPPDCLEALGAE